MLFAILRGRSPSLLELADRPSAYEDVGRLCRWGMVISALRFNDDRRKEPAARTIWNVGTMEAYVESRDRERATNGNGAAHAVSRPKVETAAALAGVEVSAEALPPPVARRGGRVLGEAPAPPRRPPRTRADEADRVRIRVRFRLRPAAQPAGPPRV